MAKQVNVGDEIDLGKVGYVREPDGGVVTSGRIYQVRREGRHVAFGNEEIEYDAKQQWEDLKVEVEADVDEDEYDDMDYPTLQQTAKGRGLNAGGSADDLRERLRADDED